MNNKLKKSPFTKGNLKKILFFSLVLMASYTSTYAQDPIVIKQDSTVRDLDSGEEQDVRELPFRQRLRFGGGIGGLSIGGTDSYGNERPTIVSVSPMVGYQVTNDFTTGLALDYVYSKYPSRSAVNLFGPRLFGQYRLKILESIVSRSFAQAEVQKYFATSAGQSTEYNTQALAGLGVGFGGFQITVLYDLTYSNTKSYSSSPWVFRIGGFFF